MKLNSILWWVTKRFESLQNMFQVFENWNWWNCLGHFSTPGMKRFQGKEARDFKKKRRKLI